MRSVICIWMLIGLLTPRLAAQSDLNAEQHNDSTLNFAVFRDSVYIYQMDEIIIKAKYSHKHIRNIQQYQKLERKVKKVYPYSLILKQRINALEQELATIEKRKDQKKKIDEAEKKLFDEFEAIVWKMSMSEGRILVKLIDRELGRSSFQLIKEYKGSFKAYFWQSLALIFGNNLDVEYDATNKFEDRQIENIIQRIESGDIPLNTK